MLMNNMRYIDQDEDQQQSIFSKFPRNVNNKVIIKNMENPFKNKNFSSAHCA